MTLRMESALARRPSTSWSVMGVAEGARCPVVRRPWEPRCRPVADAAGNREQGAEREARDARPEEGLEDGRTGEPMA